MSGQSIGEIIALLWVPPYVGSVRFGRDSFCAACAAHRAERSEGVAPCTGLNDGYCS